MDGDSVGGGGGGRRGTQGLLWYAFSLVRDLLTAVIGTTLLEAGVEHLFHPDTVEGIRLRELACSAAIAFLLGYAVFYKWKPASAKWIWVAGNCGFIWRIFQGDPQTTAELAIRVTLEAVSVRAVFYSFGALCCSLLAPHFRRRRDTAAPST